MIRLLFKYKLRVILGIIVLLIVDGIQIIVPVIVKRAIDNLSQGIYSHLLYYAIIIVLLSIVVAFFRFWWRFFIIGNSRIIERELRDKFFTHIINMDAYFFKDKNIGDLMALSTNDIEAIRMALGMGTIAIVDAVFLSLASLGMMLKLDIRLTLLALIPAPFLSLLTYIFGKEVNKRFEKQQEGFSILTEKVREILQGAKVIKGYNQEKGAIESFNITNWDYYKRILRMLKVSSAFDPILGMFAMLSIGIVLLFGAVDVIGGRITLGSFVAFFNYLNLMIWPMIAFGFVVNIFQRGNASYKRVKSVLDMEPRIKKGGKNIDIKGEIVLKDLSFSYNGENVLKDINIRFEKGKTTAIVGLTGSGKSTLVNLLLRFYESEGIFVDGTPLNEIDYETLRRSIGYVPQETFLFSDTVFNNISFGVENPNIDDVVKVAKIAMIHNEIMELPNGYDTMLGEKGVNLSGGQKQRIAIARALLVPSKILILDDALSSVDSHTEKDIMENLKDFLKTRTSIVISHRIAAIKNFDWIYVFENGRVVEEGKHRKLIEKKGLYYILYQRQKLEEEIK
uniref:ABC transporter ATP-binding protein n=1 Tax=candidate division WOR-3 bacterium TaxID=2052148 RepID=A0A7C4YG81_UNCW3